MGDQCLVTPPTIQHQVTQTDNQVTPPLSHRNSQRRLPRPQLRLNPEAMQGPGGLRESQSNSPLHTDFLVSPTIPLNDDLPQDIPSAPRLPLNKDLDLGPYQSSDLHIIDLADRLADKLFRRERRFRRALAKQVAPPLLVNEQKIKINPLDKFFIPYRNKW